MEEEKKVQERKKLQKNKSLKRKELITYISIFIISMIAILSINSLMQFIREIPNGKISILFVQDVSKENALLLCTILRIMVYVLMASVLCISLKDD